MSVKIYSFVFILFSLSMSACAIGQASSESRQEVVFDDGKNSENSDEIAITDSDLKRQETKQRLDQTEMPETQIIIADDNSKITTIFDAFGNKSESRCFNNHPRLDCVVVQTLADGTRQLLVYPAGRGGRKLSENLAEKALTASADELANAAKIYETRDKLANRRVSPYGGKKNNEPLRPLPSYEFQIPRNQQFQNTENQQNTEITIENKVDEPDKDANPPVEPESKEDMN